MGLAAGAVLQPPLDMGSDGAGPFPVAAEANVAATDRAAFMASWQEPVPVQSPLHPAKFEPEAAAAVSVTVSPSGKWEVHVEPQSRAAGLLATVPAPAPAFVTVSARPSV